MSKAICRIAVQCAASAFGERADEILGQSRRRELAHARFAVMLYLREGRRYSYPRIGALLNLNHSSVVHGVRRGRVLVDEDVEFADRVRSATISAVRAEADIK